MTDKAERERRRKIWFAAAEGTIAHRVKYLAQTDAKMAGALVDVLIELRNASDASGVAFDHKYLQDMIDAVCTKAGLTQEDRPMGGQDWVRIET